MVAPKGLVRVPWDRSRVAKAVAPTPPRCQCGRAELRGGVGMQDYVVGFLVTAWVPAERILRPWRRWPPWLKIPRWVKLEHLPKNGRLPPGCGFWHVGYQSHRGPRRSGRHRKVQLPPPLTG